MIRYLLSLIGYLPQDDAHAREITLHDQLEQAYEALAKERALTDSKVRLMANGEIENLEARVRQMAPGKLFEVYLRGEGTQDRLSILAVRASGGITYLDVVKP